MIEGGDDDDNYDDDDVVMILLLMMMIEMMMMMNIFFIYRCLGGAAVFCFIWIILLRFIAGIIVWVTLVLFLGVWAFGKYH
jgi:hypothetical protein